MSCETFSCATDHRHVGTVGMEKRDVASVSTEAVACAFGVRFAEGGGRTSCIGDGKEGEEEEGEEEYEHG